MIVLSKTFQRNVKKVHCPVCGGRLCDVKTSEQISTNKYDIKGEIIVKCHKCRNKIGISMQKN